MHFRSTFVIHWIIYLDLAVIHAHVGIYGILIRCALELNMTYSLNFLQVAPPLKPGRSPESHNYVLFDFPGYDVLKALQLRHRTSRTKNSPPRTGYHARWNQSSLLRQGSNQFCIVSVLLFSFHNKTVASTYQHGVVLTPPDVGVWHDVHFFESQLGSTMHMTPLLIIATLDYNWQWPQGWVCNAETYQESWLCYAKHGGCVAVRGCCL